MQSVPPPLPSMVRDTGWALSVNITFSVILNVTYLFFFPLCIDVQAKPRVVLWNIGFTLEFVE